MTEEERKEALEQKGALECGRCKRIHIHLSRGRKPHDCPECRVEIEEERQASVKERRLAIKTNKTAIPQLEPVTRFDIKVGETLYFMSHMFSSDISRRRYASQWKVKEIGEDEVTLKKVSTKEVITGKMHDRFHRRVGTEYVDLDDAD